MFKLGCVTCVPIVQYLFNRGWLKLWKLKNPNTYKNQQAFPRQHFISNPTQSMETGMQILEVYLNGKAWIRRPQNLQSTK
jgi:hypothetical protein